MNSEKNSSPESIDLMDALLSEHARLGSEADTPLVENVLAATIYKPAELPEPMERPSFGFQNWMKVAAAVALFFGVGAFILKQFPGDTPRATETAQFTITYLSAPGEASSAKENARTLTLDPSLFRDTSIVTPVVANIEPATIDLVKIESDLPEFPGLMADVFQTTSEGRMESFAVVAESAVRSDENLEYAGDVRLKHPEFKIQAERLVVSASSDSQQGAIQAYGATVERTLENGVIEVAHAEQLVYEPTGGALVLFGKGLQFKAGDKTLEFSEQAEEEMLILRPNGYQIVRL